MSVVTIEFIRDLRATLLMNFLSSVGSRLWVLPVDNDRDPVITLSTGLALLRGKPLPRQLAPRMLQRLQRQRFLLKLI